jgi:glycosyltransferase involved in cell wall biosynthesis
LAAAAIRAKTDLIDTFRSFEPDVVYSNTSHVIDGPAIARAFRIPHVWHLREIERVPYAVRRLYGYWLLSSASRVIAISQAVSAAYFQYGGRRVVTIPDGVDIDYYSNTRPSRLPSRFTSDRPLRLLSVGRLTPWKGQDVAIEAIIALARQGAPVQLRVVGGALTKPDQAYRQRLHDLSSRSSAITIEPEVGDVRSHYQWADVLLHTAVSAEPFGRVIVEAMAGRCAVVASDCGGPREIIRHNIDGRLIQPGNASLLAATLQELLSDPDMVARLASTGHVRASDFSIDLTARSVSGVLKDAATHKRPARRYRPRTT